ncbi:MAG: hydrogenase maturation protease [bacterium]|nr:hydrogenase maturation protease [bacterium]
MKDIDEKSASKALAADNAAGSLNSKILVTGVGNPLRKDDGIGPEVVRRLKKTGLADNVDILDGGTDAFALIDIVKHYSKVIVIDAVNMQAEPGTIRVFRPDEARLTVKSDALSTHGFGLAEALTLIDKLEIKVNLIIIGIQPGDISFGEGLSLEVSRAASDLVKLVQEIL